MKTAIELKMTAEEQKELETILDENSILYSVYEQRNGVFCEIEFWSGLGEDIVYSFEWDRTIKGFVDEFRTYARDFEPYEHACMWISMSESERERMGVPSENKWLIEDAEEIKQTLETVDKELNEKFN